MDWFLYGNGLRHKKVEKIILNFWIILTQKGHFQSKKDKI